MPERRDRYDIYVEILALLSEGPRKPTRILQACNLRYDRFVEYMQKLRQKDYVREIEHEGEVHYMITEKGLEVCRQWVNIMKDFQFP